MRRVAIILNQNAQGVTASRIARVRAIVGDEHVFVTASADDARDAIAAIVARSYDVLCTGGGDGTFVHAVGELRAHAHVLRGSHHALRGIVDHLVCGVRVEVDARCPAHQGGEVWWPAAPVELTPSPRRVAILRAP